MRGERATLTMEDMRLRAEEKWKRCRMVAVSFSAPLCFGLETQPAVCVHPMCQKDVKNTDIGVVIREESLEYLLQPVLPCVLQMSLN